MRCASSASTRAFSTSTYTIEGELVIYLLLPNMTAQQRE
jgi:hypothetical protein